jgi:hypothetical protein
MLEKSGIYQTRILHLIRFITRRWFHCPRYQPTIRGYEMVCSNSFTAKRLACAMLFISICVISNYAQAPVLEEISPGMFVAEMELVAATDKWSLKTDNAGYSGEGYYLWGSAGGSGIDGSPNKGLLEYKFNIKTAGAYELMLHNWSGGPKSDEANDCFTWMDDANDKPIYKTFQGHYVRQWNWEIRHEVGTNPTAVWYLTPGIRTLRFWGRSEGFCLDRFTLVHTPIRNGTGLFERRAEAQSLELPLSPVQGDGTGARPIRLQPARRLSGGMRAGIPVAYTVNGRMAGELFSAGRFSTTPIITVLPDGSMQVRVNEMKQR